MTSLQLVQSLADDCLIEILQFLPTKFLLFNCCLVSKKWKSCTYQTKLSIQLQNVKVNKFTQYNSESLKVINSLHIPFTTSSFEVESILNLSNLSNLKSLNISHINGNDIIVNICKNHQQLTRLVLRSCSIDDNSLNLIGSNLKLLTSLNISRNNITINGIKHLEKLNNLSSLYMNSNNLGSMNNNNEILNLKNISSNLTELHLFDCNLNSIEDLKSISSTENKFKLKNLDLSNNNLSIDSLNQLFNNSNSLNELTHLYLEQTGLTIDGIKIIINNSNISKLKHLGLSNNLIKDEGIELICKSKNMSNLETLLIGQCIIGNDGLLSLSKSEFITKLTNLDICFNDFNSEGIKYLFTNSNNSNNLYNLKYLNISSCFLNNESIKYFENYSFKFIKSLNLSDNQISDEGIKYLSLNNSLTSNLINLNLFANNISNEGVKYLFETFKNLQILDLSVNNITNEGIQFISLNNNLKILTIVDNNFIGASNLVQSLQNLETLIIGQSSLLDKDYEILQKYNFKKESTSLDLSIYQGVFTTFKKIIL